MAPCHECKRKAQKLHEAVSMLRVIYMCLDTIPTPTWLKVEDCLESLITRRRRKSGAKK